MRETECCVMFLQSTWHYKWSNLAKGMRKLSSDFIKYTHALSHTYTTAKIEFSPSRMSAPCCDRVLFRASAGAREGITAACKSSRTLLCECGGWEAAALCSAQPFSLYNAELFFSFLFCSLWWSLKKRSFFDFKFFFCSETRTKISTCVLVPQTRPFVHLIKDSVRGGGGSVQLLSAYIGYI